MSIMSQILASTAVAGGPTYSSYAVDGNEPDLVGDFPNYYFRKRVSFTEPTIGTGEFAGQYVPHNAAPYSDLNTATVGVIGSGGALPTGWTQFGGRGEVVSVGVEANGTGYFDFKVTDGDSLSSLFVITNGSIGLTNQNTHALFAKIVSSTNVSSASLSISTSGTTSTISSDETLTSTYRKIFREQTCSLDNQQTRMHLSLSSSAGWEITIRIGGRHIYRSDSPGMADNPDRGDTYVPTTGSGDFGSEWQEFPDWDDLFTHSGLTAPATQYDSTGNLVWSPHNILHYSEDLTNAWWVKDAVTVVGGFSDPDDGNSAFEITTTSVSSSFRTPNPTGAWDQYEEWTFGAWMRLPSGSGRVDFILVGSSGTNVLASHTVTETWTYFEVVGKPTTNGTNNRVQIGSNDDIMSTHGAKVQIYKPRLYGSDLGGMADNPSTGDSYVPTTTAAVYLPRLQDHYYNGTSWVAKGCTIEPTQATNLLTDSNTFASLWNSTAVADFETSPTGQTDATKWTDDNDGGTGGFRTSTSVTVNAETEYTFSFFVKAGPTNDKDYIEVKTLGLETADQLSRFTFSTETWAKVGGVGSHSYHAENCGGGWYRIGITFTTAVGTTGGTLTIQGEGTPRDGTNYFFLYGKQFELGSLPSSYIPTNGATETRGAETLIIPAANQSISTTDASLYLDGTISFADINNTNMLNPWYILADSSNYLISTLNTGGSFDGLISFQQKKSFYTASKSLDALTEGLSVEMKIAAGHSTDTVNGAVNGSATGTGSGSGSYHTGAASNDIQVARGSTGTSMSIRDFRIWEDINLGATNLNTVTA